MKAMASIRNKIKKPSRSTVLFWVGSLVAVLGAVLPLITGAQLVLSILGVGGIVLAAWQKFSGGREQQQQFEHERKTREAAEQFIYDRTPEGRHKIAINQLRASMDKGRHQQTTQ